MPTADLIGGDYLVRFEARTLDDIRAFGGNNEEDDTKFAAAARVSEINLGLYRTFCSALGASWANEGVAEWMRRFHPLRLQYEMFSHANPFMRPLLSAWRSARKPSAVSKDNAFWQAQEQVSDWIETSLDAYRDMRDHMSEATVPCDLWLAPGASARWPQGFGCGARSETRQGRRAPRFGRASGLMS